LGCGEDRDLFRGDEAPQGLFHVVYVPLVGEDDEGTTAVFDHFHGEGRECRRPVIAGEDLPGRPGGLAPQDRINEGFPVGVAGPVRQVGFSYLAEVLPGGGGVGVFRTRVAGGDGETDERALGARREG